MISHVSTETLDALAGDELPYAFDVIDLVRASIAAIVSRYSGDDTVSIMCENGRVVGYRFSDDRTLGQVTARAERDLACAAGAVVVAADGGTETEEVRPLLRVSVAVAPDGATLRWIAPPGTSPEELARMASHHARLLHAIAQYPHRPVAAVTILSADERTAILAQSCGPASAYERNAEIHDVFARVVASSPEAIAVVTDEAALTYAALDACANRLARHLHAVGVMAGSKVGVALERSIDVPIVLLAILKAGAAYVPLDTSNAHDRLAMMIEDAAVGVVVMRDDARDWSALGVRCVVDLTEDAHTIASHRSEAYRIATAPQSSAYVMYTSGSTGRPKGVEVGHRAVLRLVRGADYVTIARDDVVMLLAPLSFDASTFELWAPLLNGATLAIAPPGKLSLPEIGAALDRFGVTTLWLTAPLFRLMVEMELPRFARLRRLLTGGDVVSAEHAARFVHAFPECALIDGYGPTENTTFSCTYRVAIDEPVGDPLPIGKPIANSTAYVLDRRRELVPVGVVGELYVGGDGVARGYCNRPDLTAKQFLRDPFALEADARMYRTGDLARWREDGLLEYLGRIDRQVKIRGFRVEPEEIEAALAAYSDVLDAAVVVDSAPTGNLLHAFVSIVPGGAADERAIRDHLAASLPEYMLPQRITILEALPMLESGKVDRIALAGLAGAAAEPLTAPRVPASDGGATLDAAVAEIWKGVLRSDTLPDLDQNFFDVGGDSLTLMALHKRLEDEFDVSLSIVDLFSDTTVRKQARTIARLRAT